MNHHLTLPPRSQIVCNTILRGEDITQTMVEQPGHMLYLTNGGIRICHWFLRYPCDCSIGGSVLMAGVNDSFDEAITGGVPLPLGSGAFLAYVMEWYPQQIRVGIAPGAPYNPCPYYGAA